MSSDSVRQPFLGYADDDPEKEEARQFRQVKTSRANILPYIVVCFATSVFWAGLFYLFHPGNGASTHAPATTPPALTTTTTTTTTPPTIVTLPSGPAGRPNATTGARLLTCGADAAAARAAGCRYDAVLEHWVPAACHARARALALADDDLDAWAAGGWWADEALTAPLTAAEAAARPWHWTAARDRARRCAALWRRQFWALYLDEGRRALDTVVAGPDHADRCARFLVEAGDGNWTRPVRTEVGFAGCWVREDR